MKVSISLLVLVIATANCQNEYNLTNYYAQGIVPEVLDKIPKQIISVTYPNKTVTLGNELIPREAAPVPNVLWSSQRSNFYTLLLVDLSAHTGNESTNISVNHWLVGNVPGHNVSGGDTIRAYIGPGPINGTGKHRYTFIVYEQRSKLTFNESRTGPLSRVHRHNFILKDFVNKYRLGEPIGANFFLAQWDSYVIYLNQLVSFNDQCVVPDVLDKVPNEILNVTYNGEEVIAGSNLTSKKVASEPRVTWEADEDSYYTLMFVAPDYPSRQYHDDREVNQWLVTNIRENRISSGHEIAPFLKPTPIMGTGYARYVFILYKQPRRLTFDEPRVTTWEERKKFDNRKFAKKYNLGDPVAANFFNTEIPLFID